MKIHRTSRFKDEKNDLAFFEMWVNQLESLNGRKYERFELSTSLGKTHVWGLNTQEEDLETLVIFPGARTTSLIWDFDKGLENLNNPMKIFLVEPNGLPNLSEGKTPDILSLDYGRWANEVLEGLDIENAFLAGASFGGLICMKLAIVHPEKVKAMFLLNPGCLQPFSLGIKNLYYNLLPIFKPTEENVEKFLNKAIFSKPNHQLSASSEKMLVDYEIFAISRYDDKTQKPYFMEKELKKAKVETYLVLGDQDLLFPLQKSIESAMRHLKHLKEIKVFQNVGHGIETYDKALNYIGQTIRKHSGNLQLSQPFFQQKIPIT